MNALAKPRKLLIFTSATGAGHDTHAEAAVQWCEKKYGPRVEVRVEHLLENSHPIYRAGVYFYNRVQRAAPWFHHIYYQFVELLDLINSGTVSLGREYVVAVLQEFQPDAVLSVHDCLNRGYFELAREVLGAELRCATYCPEFEGGYGFSKNWVNRQSDYFFARTKEAIESSEAAKLGAGKAMVAGHWVAPLFYAERMTEEEKKKFLVKELGLDEKSFTLLLSTGGAGAQNHGKLLDALAPFGSALQVIALCGRDEEARRGLEQDVAKRGMRVRVLGYRQDMKKLLEVSNAVVARAGATTAGEALLCGCPVIFNAIGGMMPQECPTWRYFKQHELGHVMKRAADLEKILRCWLEHPEKLGELRKRMASCRDVTTPELALSLLLE
jgi:processive 1,2-diacylglycerol beta-glucosyltransferase